jgi:hypothetical protein
VEVARMTQLTAAEKKVLRRMLSSAEEMFDIAPENYVQDWTDESQDAPFRSLIKKLRKLTRKDDEPEEGP